VSQKELVTLFRIAEKYIKISIVEPKRKRPLGKLRHKWEDNTKMELKIKIRCQGVDWIQLAQEMNLWVP
jgi:hypothetical protein